MNDRGESAGESAGVGLRAVARIADVVLVLVPAWLILVPLLLGWVGTQTATIVVVAALAWGIVVGYEAWFTTVSGQTIGKRTVGIRVVSLDTGLPPRRIPSLLRAALPPVAAIALPAIGWVIPYLWAVWDPQGRGLHDRLAGTRVVPVSG